MTMDRERATDELFEDASNSRAQLAEVTRRLCWFVEELQHELERETRESDESGR